MFLTKSVRAWTRFEKTCFDRYVHVQVVAVGLVECQTTHFSTFGPMSRKSAGPPPPPKKSGDETIDVGSASAG